MVEIHLKPNGREKGGTRSPHHQAQGLSGPHTLHEAGPDYNAFSGMYIVDNPEEILLRIAYEGLRLCGTAEAAAVAT